MASLSPGFHGRGNRSILERLPPGQYPTESFPVLSAGRTPQVPTDNWSFTVTSETGESHSWTWEDILALPQEQPVVDNHCVTRWTKFDTRWQGVCLDSLIGAVASAAEFVIAQSFDGMTRALAKAASRACSASAAPSTT
ncbi:molybdopterin-dependent oxidoreductase [Streptomyces sp. NPDC085944]|uniref:molybdopterin-dependent oxidoreductase n=1 Tax=Streptomyces sp. NPDC085944 TaxID=3154962 RepID=UPI00343E74B1